MSEYSTDELVNMLEAIIGDSGGLSRPEAEAIIARLRAGDQAKADKDRILKEVMGALLEQLRTLEGSRR